MNKKWNNILVDEQLSQRNILRISNLDTISAPSITKIEWKCMICNEHWTTTVDSVLNLKSGCPYCAGNIKFTIKTLSNRLKKDNRTIQVLELFDGHKNNERKGKFSCNECAHIWTSIVSNVTHKQQGCPKCGKSGRYTANTIKKLKNIPGIFYIIICEGNNEHFLKIGITKRNVKNRYTNVDFGYKIINSVEINMFLEEAWKLEQHILKYHQTGRYIPNYKFGGKNECYIFTEYSTILSIIEEKTNERVT